MAEEGGGGVCQDAGADFDAVVELRVVEDGEAGADGAAFGVIGAVDKAGDASLNHSAGAHRAGLNGDVQGGVEEPVVAEAEGRFAEGDDFGVGCGVGIGDGAIAGVGDDVAAGHDDGADGDFAARGGVAGFVESGLHEFQVEGGAIGHRRREYTNWSRCSGRRVNAA